MDDQACRRISVRFLVKFIFIVIPLFLHKVLHFSSEFVLQLNFALESPTGYVYNITLVWLEGRCLSYATTLTLPAASLGQKCAAFPSQKC